MTTTTPTPARTTPNGKPRPAAAEPEGDPWTNGAAVTAAAVANDRPRRVESPPLPTFELTWRKPTGTATFPLILLEGDEYALKSTLAVELFLDKRIGERWMLPVGEEIDWLGEIADFQIANHNGQWWQIIAAVEKMHARATAIRAEGGKPPALILDSGTKVWELLSTWAEYRARTSEHNKRRLTFDRNAEIDVGHTYWNAANRRHRRLVHLLRSMPAVVVVTARGKMVSAFDEETNKPIPGRKVYSVQANSELPFATTAWVRVARNAYPQIIGARMAKGGIRPGDPPLVIDPKDDRFRHLGDRGFNLPWLVFEVLRFDPQGAPASQAIEPAADAEPDDTPPAPGSASVLDDADETPGQVDGDVIHPSN